jgi:hypothetical protein
MISFGFLSHTILLRHVIMHSYEAKSHSGHTPLKLHLRNYITVIHVSPGFDSRRYQIF